MTASSAPQAATRQLPTLDTLRAVGALGVLTTHAAFWAGAYTQYGVWGSVLARLDVGVAIFFVLSGFLLSRPWIARANEGLPAPEVRRYARHRVLRIFPVYLVAAVIALSFVRDNRDFGVGRWLSTLTLTETYVRDKWPAGITQMWSLATEVAFYVVLPLLMLVGIGRKRHLHVPRLLALLVGMIVVSVVWRGAVSTMVEDNVAGAAHEWLPGFLGWFAVGIGLALLDVLHRAGTLPRVVARATDRWGSAPGTCWVIVLGLMLVAATPVAGPTLLAAPTESQAVTKNLIYALVGGLVVFTGVFARPGSAYARVMSYPALRHLGKISYGVFCIHLVMLHLVMRVTGYDLFDGHLWQILVLTLLFSVVAAELLYRVVELPFLRLKDSDRRSATTATTPESATSTR